MIQEKETTAVLMPVEMILKNGRKKHGILLDTEPGSTIASCQFICFSRVKDFEETKDHSLIEIIPFNTVESIDTFIR